MGISFHGCEFLLPIFQETYGTDATADEIMGDFGGVLKNQSIGVASADPVALDLACLDLVFNHKAQPGDDEKPLIERIDRWHGTYITD